MTCIYIYIIFYGSFSIYSRMVTYHQLSGRAIPLGPASRGSRKIFVRILPPELGARLVEAKLREFIEPDSTPAQHILRIQVCQQYLPWGLTYITTTCFWGIWIHSPNKLRISFESASFGLFWEFVCVCVRVWLGFRLYGEWFWL